VELSYPQDKGVVSPAATIPLCIPIKRGVNTKYVRAAPSGCKGVPVMRGSGGEKGSSSSMSARITLVAQYPLTLSICSIVYQMVGSHQRQYAGLANVFEP